MKCPVSTGLAGVKILGLLLSACAPATTQPPAPRSSKTSARKRPGTGSLY
jgi:hypothetical protein